MNYFFWLGHYIETRVQGMLVANAPLTIPYVEKDFSKVSHSGCMTVTICNQSKKLGI